MLLVCMNWKLHCKSLMMRLWSGVILRSAIRILSCHFAYSPQKTHFHLGNRSSVGYLRYLLRSWIADIGVAPILANSSCVILPPLVIPFWMTAPNSSDSYA
jgi:hypothetical protein